MKLTPYDVNWPVLFEKERAELASTLGDLAARIEHVGSTSVPGLQAKAVIDIQVSVRSIDLQCFQKRLTLLGYKHLPTESPPVDVYPFFHKPARWPTTHHVHFCEVDSEQEVAHLAFRDWLRAHPEDRAYYGELKDKLAKDVDESDVKTLFAYTEKKSAWVQEITRKAIQSGMGA